MIVYKNKLGIIVGYCPYDHDFLKVFWNNKISIFYKRKSNNKFYLMRGPSYNPFLYNEHDYYIYDFDLNDDVFNWAYKAINQNEYF